MSGHEQVMSIMVLPEGMPLDHDEAHAFAFYVEWKGPREDNGQGGYAVTRGGRNQMSRGGAWSYPQPFRWSQYRWETLEEALEMARKHIDSYKMNGYTWAEWQEKLK